MLREQAGTLAPPKSDIHKVRYNCNTKALKQLSTVLEEGVVFQVAVFVLSRNATQRGALCDETKRLRERLEGGGDCTRNLRKKEMISPLHVFLLFFPSSLRPSVPPYLFPLFS